MLKFLVYDAELEEYVDLPREEVIKIIPASAVELFELAFLSDTSEKRPDDCICSDRTFDAYGCMCRNRDRRYFAE